METLLDDWDDRRLSQKSSLLFQKSRINSAWTPLKSKKNNPKMFAWWALRESPLHEVLDVTLCLRGTLLACRRRTIKRKRTTARPEVRSPINIHHYVVGLFAKYTQKFYCLNRRHRWRLRVSCRWGDRGDHMETTYSPSRPDRLQNFFETTGAIRTIIWKPGLTLTLKVNWASIEIIL